MATNNIYPFSSLTGGTNDGYLDFHPVASLVNNDFAFGIVSGIHRAYHYDTSSAAAENSPYVIIPDDNVSGTGAWILDSPGGAFSHVYATTTTESIPNAADTNVVYDSEIYDVLSEYDHTTGIFTATYTGYYQVSCGLYFPTSTSWTAAEQVLLMVELEGTIVIRMQKYAERTASYRLGHNLSVLIKADAADEINIAAYQNSGGALTVEASTAYNYLKIDRIV